MRFLALFLLLASRASALDVWSTPLIASSVDTSKIRTDAVTSAKILNGAVETKKLTADIDISGYLTVAKRVLAKFAAFTPDEDNTGLTITNSVGRAALKLISILNDAASLSWEDASGQVAYADVDRNAGTTFTLSTNIAAGTLALATAQTVTAIFIDSSQRVGIGTTVPGYKLHLSSGVINCDGTGCALQVFAGEAENAVFRLYADDGDDAADQWRFTAGTDGTLNIFNAAGAVDGNYLTINSAAATVTVGENGTLATSSATFTGSARLAVKTKAFFDATTPVVGDTYLCSDCTIPYSVCVGTGATVSGFKVSHSATVGCGTNN